MAAAVAAAAGAPRGLRLVVSAAGAAIVARTIGRDRTAHPIDGFVIGAVLYASAAEVVAHYGDALSGKILVDITNPFITDASGLVTTAGNSVSTRSLPPPPRTHTS